MTKAAELAKMGEVLTNSQIGSRKNFIINGGMQLSQRASSTSGVGASTPVFPCVDRFRIAVGGTTAGRATISHSTDTPSGFSNSVKIDCTTADTSISADEAIFFQTLLEGQDLQRIKKGTSDAESLTLSFYVKGNASATYTCEIRDLDNDRINTQTFEVTTSWNRVILNFIPDTTGAFGVDNGASIQISFILHAGSTYTSGTFASNTWAARVQGNRASPSQTSIFDSTDRELFMTGVQLEVGSVATPFEHLSVAENLQLCQRYYYLAQNFYGGIINASNTTLIRQYNTFPVQMRNTPSVTLGAISSGWSLSTVAIQTQGHSVEYSASARTDFRPAITNQKYDAEF